MAPSNVYPTSDSRLILIAANQDTVFKRLTEAMGRPELAADARYATHSARGANQKELDELISDWTRTITAERLEQLMDEFGIPSGKIYRAPEMLADPAFPGSGGDRHDVRIRNSERCACRMSRRSSALTPGRRAQPGARSRRAQRATFTRACSATATSEWPNCRQPGSSDARSRHDALAAARHWLAVRNEAATIGPIAGVTIATPDLAAAENAYVRDLGYRLDSPGHASAGEQAQAWNRPAAAAAPLCYGASGGRRRLRIPVRRESRMPRGYRAFSSFGWNAAELIVSDVDAMADELAGSPFEILGPPQDLSFTDAIRAMQVRGPAGEILYLTQFKRDLPTLPAPPARCKVDRVFIVIVGGASLDDAAVVLHDHVWRAAAAAHGIPRQSHVRGASVCRPEHRYQIAALPLRGRCYIEADQMPPPQKPPIAAGPSAARHRDRQLPVLRTPVDARLPDGPAGEIIEIVAA